MRSKSCLFYPAWQFIYVKLVCAWCIFRCIFNFVLPRLLLKCGYLFLQNNAKNLSIYLPIYLYLLYTYLYISISIYIYIYTSLENVSYISKNFRNGAIYARTVFYSDFWTLDVSRTVFFETTVVRLSVRLSVCRFSRLDH